MKNCGMGTFMRSRRFGSYFDAWSGLDLGAQSRVVVKGELEGKKQKTRDNVYVEDDGWLCVLISWIRIVVCFVSMMVTTLVWAVIMLVLLPWPYQRIRQGNIYGHVTGRMLVSYFLFYF
nr:1-acyl-sn-glycerol-3-phosphate acyltransferase-like [Ipomoea batatas]